MAFFLIYVAFRISKSRNRRGCRENGRIRAAMKRQLMNHSKPINNRDHFLIACMCKYEGVNAVLRITNNNNISDLCNKIVSKWSELAKSKFDLSYALHGHSNCMLANQSDFQEMILLTAHQNIELLDICIQRRLNDSSGSNGASTSATILLNNGGESGVMTGYYCHLNGLMGSKSCWLKKYVIEIEFNFCYLKNDKVRVTAACSVREEKKCPWFMHGRVMRENGIFYIRNLANKHTCGFAFNKNKNKRMSSEIVSSCLTDDVRTNPKMRPVDVVDNFKRQYGIEISNRNAWLGVVKARNIVFGDYSTSSDQL